MLYVEFNAGGKTYKLRLNTHYTILLEKQLGCNPLSIFGAGDTIPTVTTMVSVLHYSLQQYQHNIGLEDAYNIFDEWLEDGNAVTDFIKVMVDIFKASGIIKENRTEKN